MKVICVSDSNYDIVHTLYIENYPKKGEIYTIRKRVHTPHGVGYLLEEISNPIMPNGVEPNFHSSRFRAVEEESDSKITTN
jgi:hypothetical protein